MAEGINGSYYHQQASPPSERHAGPRKQILIHLGIEFWHFRFLTCGQEERNTETLREISTYLCGLLSL